MSTIAGSQGSPTGASSSHRGDGLNVIALVSGGKDSFFSLLHCLANGHRVVALANLYPPPPAPPPSPSTGRQGRRSDDQGVGADTAAEPRPADHGSTSGGGLAAGAAGANASELSQRMDSVSEAELGILDTEEVDLNSFMYQTVGHQVIPLYAAATGIPLYRQPIAGGAAQSGKDYACSTAVASSTDGTLPGSETRPKDETESMVPLYLPLRPPTRRPTLSLRVPSSAHTSALASNP